MKNTIINPPSTFPPYLLSRSLAVSHPRFLPPSRTCSLRPSHLLFSLAPFLSHIIASSLHPAPCSLRPSHLLFSLPPSMHLAARLPPAVQLNIHRVYTVLVSCTGYCVGRAHPGGVTQPGVALRQWSGCAISRWIAVTLATHPHNEFVFD